MTARWLVGAALGGVALAGCDPLPRPDYVDVKYPASYRTEPGGVRVDNGGYKLDAQGYRVDPQGERVGMIEVPEKTAGDKSNAVAGYYISSTGADDDCLYPGTCRHCLYAGTGHLCPCRTHAAGGRSGLPR